jgi:hypothetical protein
LTVTFTVAELLASVLSVIANLKVNRVSDDIPEGATNDGTATLALLNATVGPAVCIHKQDLIIPSGSALLVPLNVTVSPALTI